MRNSIVQFRPSFFLFVPTMACQASCKYCFAPKGGNVMDRLTAESAIDFIARIAPEKGRMKIVFHGGEPLLAGVEFLEFVFSKMRDRFGARLKLSIQSNLWEINGAAGAELIHLFQLYDVTVGTSIDGFREMCDSQRGEGYYERTAAAIRKLQKNGIQVGRICTFGRHSVNQAKQVFEEAEGSYSIHGAVPSFVCRNHADAELLHINAEEMKKVYLDSYDAYRKNPSHARISFIDSMEVACFRGESPLCTFQNCLGHFAAIAPNGHVYSCQRFVDCEGFCLGNVKNNLAEGEIIESLPFRCMIEKQEQMESACYDCAHRQYCHGGCLYNAFVGDAEKDPYCEAYKAVFDRIKIDMALEMAGEMKRNIFDSPVLELRSFETPVLSMISEKK